MDALGELYLDKQRWDKAEKWCKQAILGALLTKSDEKGPHVLYMKTNLALALTNQERWSEAAELYEQVFQANEDALCREDLDISAITVMSNLAWAYTHLRRWGDAEELTVKVVNGRKRLLGLHHPGTVGSMARLAQLYAYQGKKEDAEALDAEVGRVAPGAREEA
jgi:tetratricopeptide (TPR) repeat protein